MRRIELPDPFLRYDSAGGVLQFAAFDGVAGDTPSLIGGIAEVVPETDAAALEALGGRRIDEATLLGDAYDRRVGALVAGGSHRTEDGRLLADPLLRDLEGVELSASARAIADPGSGGQLAAAFSNPPYRLRSGPAETDRLFAEILRFILPPGHAHEVVDWSSPRLPEVSSYFEDGMEWWGVFLFTIHTPALGRLVVIAGSATD